MLVGFPGGRFEVPLDARPSIMQVVLRAAAWELDPEVAERTYVSVRRRAGSRHLPWVSGVAWRYPPGWARAESGCGKGVLRVVALYVAVEDGRVVVASGERREERHAGRPVSWVAEGRFDDLYAVAVHEFAHVSQFERDRVRGVAARRGSEVEANAKAALALREERAFLRTVDFRGVELRPCGAREETCA